MTLGAYLPTTHWNIVESKVSIGDGMDIVFSATYGPKYGSRRGNIKKLIFFRADPKAYGSSQARCPIRAVDVGLHHSSQQ